MRAWLERRRRLYAMRLVAAHLVPRVQRCCALAAASERGGFHLSAAEARREAVQLADVLRCLEVDLVGRELTLWLGDL